MSRPLRLRYRLLLVLAWLTLLWEAVAPRLLPVFGVIAAFVVVALLDVLPALPGWLHALALLAVLVGLGIAARRGWRGWRPITRDAARHRLERDSGLEHRPLTALEDALATGGEDAGSRDLWRAHMARMAAAVGRLRLRGPAANMAGTDPYGLRVVLVMLLVIAIAGGDDAGQRLARALAPDFAGEPPRPVTADLWITPPAYTRAAPVFLQSGDAAAHDTAAPAPLRVPQGSTVLAQVKGGRSTPTLDLGVTAVAFEVLGADVRAVEAHGADGRAVEAHGANTPTASFRAEAVIDAATRLAVIVDRRTIAAWPVEIVGDAPPTIDFADKPAADASAYLAIQYAAEDDYGLVDVTAVVRRLDGGRTLAGDTEIRLPLTLPDLGGGPVRGGGAHDLAAHVWAGQAVRILLEAEDGIGQIGRSEAVTVVLPERTFSHPVAIAVIEQRQRLRADVDHVRLSVSRGLAEIAAQPEDFANDVVVSLGLAVAGQRLIRERSADAIPSVRALLWDVALRIEQGTVPVAEQMLREAQQRLAEALRDDRSAADVDQLIRDLQQALQEYLRAVAAELARRGEALADLPADAQRVRPQDIMDLVETARQLAKAGARESARQMLNELQRMIDAMRNGLEASAGSREMLEANQLMNDLRALADRQQDLLDETFRRLQAMRAEAARRGGGWTPSSPFRVAPDLDAAPGADADADAGEESGADAGTEPGDGGADGGADDRAEQDAMRQALGELMLRFNDLLGGIPAPLGSAERAMKRAGDALEAGRLGDAVPQQTEAVRQLQQAGEQAGQMLAEQLGGMVGLFGGGAGQPAESGSDPFGRPGERGERGFGMDAVEIPDRMRLRRVEEILQELRRRAGEYERPQAERDYIDRLLRRF